MLSPALPRCSDYFTRGKSVRQWPNLPLKMNLMASKIGSSPVTPLTLPAPLSLFSSSQPQLSSNTHAPTPFKTHSPSGGFDQPILSPVLKLSLLCNNPHHPDLSTGHRTLVGYQR
jgi:hypothetical protein